MYTSFYGMSTNPFLKDESSKYPFESEDYLETINRFKFLTDVKGIGLFIGSCGLGKTYTIRSFINSLNNDLYKIIYINPTSRLKVFDFYKLICDELCIDVGNCYRSDITFNIQNELIRLVNQDRINPIIIIDDAHLLSREVLFNLKVLYDFEMDSKNYVTLILVGLPKIKDEISKDIHSSLNQRIIVNYSFNGLSKNEVKDYIKSRLELSNSNKDIFEENALLSLYACCKSSPRRLNTLVINSLMLGFQANKSIIDAETIMYAKKEMDLK